MTDECIACSCFGGWVGVWAWQAVKNKAKIANIHNGFIVFPNGNAVRKFYFQTASFLFQIRFKKLFKFIKGNFTCLVVVQINMGGVWYDVQFFV